MTWRAAMSRCGRCSLSRTGSRISVWSRRGRPWSRATVAAAAAGEVAGLVDAAARYVFDLAGELPVRASLFSVSDEEHVLVLVCHHIASDGWSMQVLMADLAAAYEARLGGREPGWDPLPVQYADYALWQQELLGTGGAGLAGVGGGSGGGGDDDDAGLAAESSGSEGGGDGGGAGLAGGGGTGGGGVLAGQVGYWREALAGLPEELALPYDRPRPAVPSQRGGQVRWELAGPELHGALARLARDHR